MGRSTADTDEILIVEDDVLVRVVVAEAMEDAGFRVVTAENGDEAMKYLVEGMRPAAVITDIEMPGDVDGIKLARWLSEQLSSVRVLVVSGRHTEGSELLPQGAGFLAKPFGLDDLVARVRGH